MEAILHDPTPFKVSGVAGERETGRAGGVRPGVGYSRLGPAHFPDFVEVPVVAGDSFRFVDDRGGGVKDVTSHQGSILVEKGAREVHDLGGDGNDDGYDPPGEIVDLAAVLPSAYGLITVQDLLKDLRVNGRIDLSTRHALQEDTAGILVGMGSAPGIHEDVRVDQDHEPRSSRSGTDSRAISDASPTGRDSSASSRTASSRSSSDTVP